MKFLLVKFLLASAMVMAFCGSARAQPYDAPPKPAQPRPLRISAPTEQTLPNGLRVVVAERRGVPLVSARLVVLSGSEVDADQRAGLASITAGLLTRGTIKRSAPALVQAAEALGSSLDSGASWHQSSVGMTVTTPQLRSALALMSEVARQPAFAPDEIERYRTQALDDLKVTYSEPRALAALVAQRALHGTGSYGHPVDGTPGSLARITRADILAHHAAVYRPDNAVLILAGDIDLAQAVKLARDQLGSWKKPAIPLLRSTPPTANPWPEPVTEIDMPSAGQASVVLLLPAVAAGAPDRIAGAVTNMILGGGFSSRLSQEIRIKRGLSYGASSGLDARRDGGSLSVVAQTKNSSAPEVLTLAGAELDKLATGPVPDDELAARKATLIGNFSRSLETTSGLASQVAGLIVAGLAPADITRRIAQIEAVSPQDVQGFASKYFSASGRRAVIAGAASEFEPELKKLAPQLRILKQDMLDLDAADAAKP